MPTCKIEGRFLTPGQFNENWQLVRACKESLLARGFRLDLPVQIERTGTRADDQFDGVAIVTQEVPDRLPNNHPQLWPLLQALRHGHAEAIGRLHALLLVENDDRAAMLAGIEVTLPEDAAEMGFYEDSHTQQDSNSGTVITARQLAERELCGRALLLFG